jgi:hypothetical protein
MKNTILFTLLSIILILGACKKNAPATLVFPGGSWSFNRTAFSATECDTAGATLIATDSLTGNPDWLLYCGKPRSDARPRPGVHSGGICSAISIE